MLKLYGTLSGKPGETSQLSMSQCIQKCFDDPECLIASWSTNQTCSTYKLVLTHPESQQTLKITETPKDKKSVVAVKGSLSSSVCPSLSSVIPGSVTPSLQFKNFPVTYNWTKTKTGWSIKQCSACVLSRTARLHLCVKLHNSEQLDVNYVGGFSQADAVRTSGQQQKKLLGLASPEEIDFVLKSRSIVNTESYWIGGTASNCVNGVCTKVTWTDGWTTTSMFKSIPTTVPNPCLAVVNGQMVGRDCNDKMLGALCAWQLS